MTKREFIKVVVQGGCFLCLYSRLPFKASLLRQALRQLLKTLTNHRRRQFLARKLLRVSGAAIALDSCSVPSFIITKRVRSPIHPPA